MFIMTPEAVRAVHEDRRRQLVREAEAHRVRRELEAARRAPRPTAERRGWFRALARSRHDDAKVARLAASWLQLDRGTARRLARVADEVELPSGTVLVPGRFSYIGLDVAHRGLVVTTGTASVTLETEATVLILTSRDLEQIGCDIAGLATFRSAPEASTHTAERLASAPIEPHGPVVSASVITHRRSAPGVRFPAHRRTVAAPTDDRAIAGGVRRR